MKTHPTPRPTDGELAILRVLWQRGPSTVRDVVGVLGAAQRVGYTTVLKLLQVMHDKGLVRRQEAGRAHVYAPSRAEADTQRQLVAHLLDRAFGGSASKLVLQALSARKATPDELAEIRRLLAKVEGGGR